VFPGSPDDACQAIGERYGRHVVLSLEFALHSPLPEVIQGTPGTLLSMRGEATYTAGVLAGGIWGGTDRERDLSRSRLCAAHHHLNGPRRPRCNIAANTTAESDYKRSTRARWARIKFKGRIR
jgi:hypothetical protein